MSQVLVREQSDSINKVRLSDSSIGVDSKEPLFVVRSSNDVTSVKIIQSQANRITTQDVNYNIKPSANNVFRVNVSNSLGSVSVSDISGFELGVQNVLSTSFVDSSEVDFTFDETGKTVSAVIADTLVNKTLTTPKIQKILMNGSSLEVYDSSGTTLLFIIDEYGNVGARMFYNLDGL